MIEAKGNHVYKLELELVTFGAKSLARILCCAVLYGLPFAGDECDALQLVEQLFILDYYGYIGNMERDEVHLMRLRAWIDNLELKRCDAENIKQRLSDVGVSEE